MRRLASLPPLSFEMITRSGLYFDDRLDVGREARELRARRGRRVGRLVVDRAHLLAGADGVEILGRRRRERDDLHRLRIQRDRARAGRDLDRVRRRGSGREREGRHHEDGDRALQVLHRALLSLGGTRPVRVSARQSFLRRLHDDTEQATRLVPSFGASRLRDSAGISPASLTSMSPGWCRAGGSIPCAHAAGDLDRAWHRAGRSRRRAPAHGPAPARPRGAPAAPGSAAGGRRRCATSTPC